uniref:Uncharacterized protein n=1 Tax=Cannabis sativa TaxID=3483 RepID=A0A803Q471_CANSA
MPVGTIIRLLSTDIGMVGTLGKLYQSLENLSDTYIQSNVDKDILLKPKSSALGQSSNLLSLTNDNHDITSHELYSCGKKSNNYSSGLGSHRSTKKYSCPNKYVADDPKATCPDCGSIVKGVVTYMIMDDLEVKPMSSISSIALLNTFNVKEIGALQEKIVSVGINEEKRVLFAEAGKDFTDFLFSLLSMPIGTIIRLLSTNGMVGTLGVVTYMIMDDLEVKPMSTISSIALLNTFNVKEVGALEEKTVSLGINEGLRLLKASLETKTVLTHVFLGK